MPTTSRYAALVAFALASCDAVAGACGVVAVEPVRALSVQRIGQLASHQVQATSDYTVLLWSFDVEGRPTRGSMRAVAFVLVSRGDLGDVPVGAIIWTDSPGPTTVQAYNGAGFPIVIGDDGASCVAPKILFSIGTDGTVSVGSKRLGQIK